MKKAVLKYWWVICLVLIMAFSFWVRYLPSKNGIVQDLDSMYNHRMDEYILSHNLQLPEHDFLRYWPEGVPLSKYGPLTSFYAPVLFYLPVSLLISFDTFVLLYPPFMGALSILVIFFVGRELFNKRVGLLSSFFLATSIAYITRTTSGQFDKETTGGLLLLLSIYFFIASYKRGSWKLSVVGGLVCGVALTAWGGSGFLLFFLPLFVIIHAVLKYEKRLLITIPFFIIAISVDKSLTSLFISPFSVKEMVAFAAVGILLLRYTAERFRLVAEANLKYVPTVLIISIVLAFLTAAMFLDWEQHVIFKVAFSMLQMTKSNIGYTVAEQAPGSWSDIEISLSTYYIRNIISFAPFDTFFCIWFLMIFGALVCSYRFVKRCDYLYLFAVLWLLLSLQTAFYMVRLIFFLAPAASICAAFFVIWCYDKIAPYLDRKKEYKEVMTTAFVMVTTILVLLNAYNAYIYCSSLGSIYNQYLDDAMTYLRMQTPINSSILSWWDFGYWFQTIGERPSIADGGNINISIDEQIADWYTAPVANWDDFKWWLDAKKVDYILMDYTLPGKYGAITHIASRGTSPIGLLQLQLTNEYQKENSTVVELSAQSVSVFMTLDRNMNIISAPMIVATSGNAVYNQNHIPNVCTVGGINRYPLPADASIIDGCIAISSLGIFFLPSTTGNTIFSSLMFMDGYGIDDVEKVFDNGAVKIYKLKGE